MMTMASARCGRGSATTRIQPAQAPATSTAAIRPRVRRRSHIDRVSVAAGAAISKRPIGGPPRPSGDQDRDAGVGAAADRVGEGDARAMNLARTGRAAQLPGELDDLAESGSTQGFALGEQAAAWVDRE